MEQPIQNECEECGRELFELDGECYCPACDSVSGFVLDNPDTDEFSL